LKCYSSEMMAQAKRICNLIQQGSTFRKKPLGQLALTFADSFSAKVFL